ncbi:hypothetical protein K438DRAFT_1927286 [Mycena galopus ATCC 62051]|nr:hypothetical protein K438DRAFT_1927286 [Mycena galopus ATCC 62051]
MAFARPAASKTPGNNTARGRPGSSTITGAKSKTVPHSRPSSVSSRQNSHSRVSAKDVVLPQSRPSSRAASVCSNQSTSASAEDPESSPPISQSSTGQTDVKLSPVSQAKPSGSGSAPQPTNDPLQVAAQVYPWIYMTSTLEACFKSAETATEKDFTTREAELAEEESDLSDQRARLEAERQIEFYEELSTDEFATAAPSIMQAFTAHGDACTLLESEALQLATGRSTPAEDDYYSPMRPYNALLEKLEEKQREQRELQASIMALTKDDGGDILGEEDPDQPSARTQMKNVFSACLPVLQARAANLQMAHELLEGAKENLAMSIHLESLEFSESDEE